MCPVQCGLTWLFFSVNGRISRQEFWLGYAGAFVVFMLVNLKLADIVFFVRHANVAYRDEIEFGVLMAKFFAAAILVWPLTTIYVKRLHDANLSGVWLFALGGVSFFATRMNIDPWNVIFSTAIVAVGLIPGSRGDNRFGTDPLAHRHA
jgi:uncharacterized membrane protein YhaH (DUF805 family)